MLESAGGGSVTSPNVTGRNTHMMRTIQNSPIGTYKDTKKIGELNLRQTLISRINNFLPAH